MSNANRLNEYEDRITTSMGAWFAGERVVFRGKDLFSELANEPWMRVLLYGITGRMFDDKQIKLFESIWVISTSYPDPRLWNNRVAALAGTARSTGALGISAAIATSEATIYGLNPVIKSIKFFKQTREKLDEGECLSDVIRNHLKHSRALPGYGRPLVNRDERITPLSKMANELGFSNGKYYKLSFQIEDVLIKERWRMKMNVAALIAGLVADQGLTCRQHYHFMTLCFTAGMFPCMIDSFEKPEGTFLPFRCDRISYEGVDKRQWV